MKTSHRPIKYRAAPPTSSRFCVRHNQEISQFLNRRLHHYNTARLDPHTPFQVVLRAHSILSLQADLRQLFKQNTKNTSLLRTPTAKLTGNLIRRSYLTIKASDIPSCRSSRKYFLKGTLHHRRSSNQPSLSRFLNDRWVQNPPRDVHRDLSAGCLSSMSRKLIAKSYLIIPRPFHHNFACCTQAFCTLPV
jgi:hypothetical protein